MGVAGVFGTACAGAGGSGDDSSAKPGTDGGGGSNPETGAVQSDTGTPVGDTGTSASEGGETGTTATPQPTAPNGYYVSGNTIYDTTGKPHLFHGVDRPSLEWDPQGQSILQTEGIPASDFQAMAMWNANVVRISLNQDFWIQGAALYNANYQATVQSAVTSAEANNVDVILDLHWSDQGNLGVTSTSCMNDTAGCSHQQPMADANSVTFWTQVATMFKGDGHVQFELYNEPNNVTPSVWLNGGTPTGANYTAVGMQALYNAVRATGANNLVIIGGQNWAYDLSQVVNGTAVTGFNIVYATHPYNQDGTLDQSADWPTYFGNLAANQPVMATEFGDTINCDGSYNASLIAYFNANNISWSGYAWWINGGCTFPTLLSGDPNTPNPAGMSVMSALAAYPAP